MINIKNCVIYCYIKINFLRVVYDECLLSKAKYINRPFVYLPNWGIAIALPEQTNHHKYKSKFCFFFNNGNNYLDIESLIYVNEKHITFKKKLNEKDKEKLKEINNRINELLTLINLVYSELKNNLSFAKEHMHIIRSKLLLKNE